MTNANRKINRSIALTHKDFPTPKLTALKSDYQLLSES
ncbi:hypothetical protein SGADD02_02272 [Streptococcus gallolyticus]|uniref:Uncharacterized protein n=1 Tax=Streptococcus gallolyticus TaxID=315405 RepID=A0A139MFS3_9STRE|nr:hypothetical protein SGADD02_02272 [Streptococcus gallolyticus]